MPLSRLILYVACAGLLRCSIAEASDRPNIVVIMADDMGFSDIGCYGGEIETPHLDRLAAGGLRFTQFYNAGRCCPTRAALMTGLYPHQVGIGNMTNREFDLGLPGYRGSLQRNGVTIAEALGGAGYRTLMVGKWHLGKEPGAWPVDRGFDEYYGIIEGASDYFSPAPQALLARNRTPVAAEGKGFYLTDALTDQAIRFVVGSAKDPGRPFFLYVAYNAPHWPIQVPPQDIAKYRGKYRAGWDTIREQRFERMRELGLADDRWVLSPRLGEIKHSAWRGWAKANQPLPEWDQLSEPERDELDLRMAIYAAMVDRMDRNIGRLIESLRALGELDNTLILFLSDNGGEAGGGYRGFDNFKPPTGLPADREKLGGPESFAAYGSGWANASNTPFRMIKGLMHEGGIATPLIAHWPARIEASGRWTEQVGHVIDVMATCLDVAGVEYPTSFHGRPITPLEGKSLVPIFEGGEREGHEALFWEHVGSAAVRAGKWKLVRQHPLDWELYDMQADRTELNDLATEHPETVRELADRSERWAVHANVRPGPYDAKDPETKGR